MTNTIKPFKLLEEFTLIFGSVNTLIGYIPEVYRNYLFTIVMVNHGSNQVTFNFVDINGDQSQQQVVIPAGQPGIALSDIPWENIAGGVNATCLVGNTNISFSCYMNQVKRDILSTVTPVELPYAPVYDTTVPPTIVRSIAVT